MKSRLRLTRIVCLALIIAPLLIVACSSLQNTVQLFFTAINAHLPQL
jgi:hypothetical protein